MIKKWTKTDEADFVDIIINVRSFVDEIALS